MHSLVTPYGYSSESCGYCKDASTGRRTPSSRASYYISSKNLTVQVYQGLVDRGWRRSGTILYKPDVLRHCCPHYTIRLPAASFTPAKDHRQVVNRWNRYVLGDEYIKDAAKIAPKSKENGKETPSISSLPFTRPSMLTSRPR
ncbi:arginine-tRNA-protein transferase [Dendryphion nanum]|uniref:Arginine-tRNA-protein transferase n=1 Tax=Dendryphion nanum TaxID=256645 RepID=A0A9P9IF45_9PLEO|nr:arginine-tRNA-protein transferase [Dendryphion nanum]